MGKPKMRKSQAGYAQKPCRAGGKLRTTESAGRRGYLFALLGQPSIQLGPRFLVHIDEAKTGAAGFVDPGNLDLRLQGCGGSGKLERHAGDSALGQRPAEANGHATLADVGQRYLEFLAFAKRN